MEKDVLINYSPKNQDTVWIKNPNKKQQSIINILEYRISLSDSVIYKESEIENKKFKGISSNSNYFLKSESENEFLISVNYLLEEEKEYLISEENTFYISKQEFENKFFLLKRQNEILKELNLEPLTEYIDNILLKEEEKVIEWETKNNPPENYYDVIEHGKVFS